MVPTWEGPFERWAMKTALKALHRCDGYTLDDLMQEARFKFEQCANRYGATVQAPQHFMALFKTSFRRWLNRLAEERSVALTGTTPIDDAFDLAGDDGATAELLGLLHTAPAEVMSLFGAILRDGLSVVSAPGDGGGPRPTRSEAWSRLSRRDGAVYNAGDMLRSFLTEDHVVAKLRGEVAVECLTRAQAQRQAAVKLMGCTRSCTTGATRGRPVLTMPNRNTGDEQCRTRPSATNWRPRPAARPRKARVTRNTAHVW